MPNKYCLVVIMVVFALCSGARLPLKRHHPKSCRKPCKTHSPSTTPEIPTSTPVSVCYFEGDTYPINQLFRPEPCRSCWCNADGAVSCAWQSCQPCGQGELVYTPGTCCPQCLTTTPFQTTSPHPGFCDYEGNLYPEGETFYPEICKFCYCVEEGFYACSFINCFVECDGETVHVPGRCCPYCRTTTTHEIEWQQTPEAPATSN